MREPEDRADRLHQRIWESLPWYVNRTLPPEAAAAVVEHAAVCDRCREEIEACKSVAQAVVEAGELAPTPHPVRLTRLLRRIDEHEARGGRAGIPALLARLRSLAAPAARPLPWMLAAQVAVLLLIGTLLFWPHQEPQFRTLSAPAAVPAEQLTLRVVFNRQATEEEIRRLLLSVRGEITGGPSPFGVYTVAVPVSGDPLAKVLDHLRRAPAVELAERAVEPAREDG
jgi:hypothetical protein